MNSSVRSEGTDHPRAETLAAFIDGHLKGRERRRMVEHLDACPDCYEEYAETVRFLQDEEPGGRVVEIGRQEPRRRWTLRPLYWTAAAIAAVLLAVVIVPGLLPDGDPGSEGGELMTARLADSLGNPEEAAGAVMESGRGSLLGMGPLSSGPPSPFRIGVRLTDLRVALAAGDRSAARRAAADLEAVDPGLTRAVDGWRWRGSTRRAVAAIETSIEPADRDELVAGARAEAGRLAAATGDAAFFRSEPGRAAHEALEARLGDAAPAPDELGALEEEFTTWIKKP